MKTYLEECPGIFWDVDAKNEEEFPLEAYLQGTTAYLQDSTPHPAIDIYVHEHCLKHGVKCESRRCPMALALIQHFGTKDIMVLSCSIYVGDRIYRMNGPLIGKLKDFDRGWIVLPYHFTLR